VVFPCPFGRTLCWLLSLSSCLSFIDIWGPVEGGSQDRRDAAAPEAGFSFLLCSLPCKEQAELGLAQDRCPVKLLSLYGFSVPCVCLCVCVCVCVRMYIHMYIHTRVRSLDSC
jgi:hypothetical protein